ncbi:hypothetical protein [Spongiimicrobium salis]|uniref:hypothetical protein n=1 Tax=Spongiimicrobium salis TaxID=1667022 RepID=UPI00374CF9B9
MKKLLLAICLMATTVGIKAQDLITKIPATADVVVTIKGKNVTDLVSIPEFENSKMGAMLIKELKRETDGAITSLDGMGFDLDASFYYFLDVADKTLYNCFLIPLNGSEGFERLMPKSKKRKMITEGDTSYVQERDGTVVLWTNKILMVVIPYDTDSIHDYTYFNEAEVPAVEADEEVILEVEEAVEVPEVVIEEEEVIEETVIEIEETDESDSNDYYNSEYYKKQEQRRKAREERRKLRRERLSTSTLIKAKTILKGYGKRNILSNPAYVKAMGKSKDEATAWVKDLGKIYQHAIPEYPGFGNGLAGFYNFDDLYGGTSITSRLNFEEDRAKMDISYTMNAKMAKHTKAMYNGTMNPNFFKYFNEDEVLGYMAVNMSTEGILKEYPKLMEDVFTRFPREEFTDVVPIAAELLSIMLDEEAIAGILRGDMLLVLNDIAEREVTYTTYEYDEEYNSKEVVKTKTETLPGFLFMFTSTEKNLFNKLVKLGVKQKGLTFENGLYRVATPRDVPFDVYLTFKDNAVVIGSAKTQMMAIRNNTYAGKVSSEHKKRISKNATSMYVNGKRIVSQIPAEAYPRELRDKIAFITKNTEDMTLTAGKIKGNTIFSEVILNTPKNADHKNSLAYFFNMVDAFMQ